MKYIKYLRRWYRTYGFSFKSPIFHPGTIAAPYFRGSWVNARHEFLTPWAFYQELKEKQRWINVAKAKKAKIAQVKHREFVSRFGEQPYTTGLAISSDYIRTTDERIKNLEKVFDTLKRHTI